MAQRGLEMTETCVRCKKPLTRNQYLFCTECEITLRNNVWAAILFRARLTLENLLLKILGV
jgi:hypothetical protein